MPRFLFSCALVFLALASKPALAQPKVVTFEELLLAPQSYREGTTLPGSFTSNGVIFNAPINNSDPGGYVYGFGFSYTNVVDTVTGDYTNAYASYFPGANPGDVSIGGSGRSANYAVVYQDIYHPEGTPAPPLPSLELPDGFRAVSVDLANTTYARASMLNGDFAAKKFGGATGNDPDWFKVTITGLDSSGGLTGSRDFYLADYRFANNSEDYIVEDWTHFDLSYLTAETSKLTFSLSSSDNGFFGMNTPAYFALDNLTIAPVPEPATVGLIGAIGLIAWRRLRRKTADPVT